MLSAVDEEYVLPEIPGVVNTGAAPFTPTSTCPVSGDPVVGIETKEFPVLDHAATA
jgi:hypothetical protein